MTALKRLERLYIKGMITEEDFAKKTDFYIEKMFDLYFMDIITKEELCKRIHG